MTEQGQAEFMMLKILLTPHLSVHYNVSLHHVTLKLNLLVSPTCQGRISYTKFLIISIHGLFIYLMSWEIRNFWFVY